MVAGGVQIGMEDQPRGGEPNRQLPVGNEIFLDHVGHFVPDVEAARSALARAGFAATPISIQVDERNGELTGTGNTTAMLARGYIEALFRTADTPLAQEFDAALARHAGVHLAAFAVADAAAAHRRLATAGLRVRPLAQMRRPAETEAGAGVAAFTVARVERAVMPEGRIQILTHHSEAEVWRPRWLTHPNGSRALTGLIIAVPDVEEAAERFARFTGRPAAALGVGQTIRLDRGRVHIVSPGDFANLVPGVAIPGVPFIGAYGILVQSIDATRSLLARAKIPTRQVGAALLAPFPAGLGDGALLFAQEPAGFPWSSAAGLVGRAASDATR